MISQCSGFSISLLTVAGLVKYCHSWSWLQNRLFSVV